MIMSCTILFLCCLHQLLSHFVLIGYSRWWMIHQQLNMRQPLCLTNKSASFFTPGFHFLSLSHTPEFFLPPFIH
ncbi:hypothetical protein HanRHA438_Chr12g0573311 [Helianthus annuus]|uniref:Secreted protein n=2 Tax=Helianthus annuus TaxID=4232 RepID=A0A9K3HJR5_HELAN|nr:hypothetical protein HanXRQr2_Chr12g0562151 [Helianthus annuus]KAJ0490921.1 hypothetical protein HanHA300_Chr12g0461101 [Helianthus annuus]KAJ0506825.1 hypothetical protein HanHA89_Chr12g0486501 [Helianthus annuus]KAJ0864405.1 hypothetical protein HanPSC8_Chr12g0541621 [Helianthus annuus]KAJ0868321.1 hypothetical protein HanRHA438_Chr12g0573311 [Helianthus annuus]